MSETKHARILLLIVVGSVLSVLIISRLPSNTAAPSAQAIKVGAETSRKLEEYHQPHNIDDDPKVRRIIDRMERTGSVSETGKRIIKNMAEDFKKAGV